ncbi:GNAT family N-acetyltransferase [Alteribacillus sp. HJP-4]|uniref:GNAT family N-acetyltransferase n=1 Tax=Alteribacillus sp. HJP-4 TaxID=2775394 RepID=UPI0035CCE09F
MVKPEVRKAELKDLTPLTKLMNEYIVDFYLCTKPEDEKLHNLIRTLLNEKEGIQFIALKEEKMVGFATLYFSYATTSADKITIMNDLYTVKEVRGEGIAAELFNACHTYTQENNYYCMKWETARSNKRAQQFYKKMGAVPGDWITYNL